MTDDAAGAVRRTPRPTEDTCRAYDVDGETVRVHGGKPLDEAGQAALGEIVRAATAKLAAEHPNLGVTQELIMAGLAANRAIHDGEVRGGCTIQDGAKVKARLKAAIGAARDALGTERRPTVLLRADDCACRYGEDCPHGPEPVDALDLAVWLHAEEKHQHTELLAQRDSWWDHVGREQAKIAAERDEAVALCASLQSALLSRLADLAKQAGKLRTDEWLRTCALLPLEEWPPAPAYKGPMVPASERDALQDRVDTALQLIHVGAATGPHFLTPDETSEIRAALQGDQPTEPDTRCMNGPAKQHTLRMVEIIKALRAASADGVLPGELDDRASFAQLARAIVDHWPTGEPDRG